LFVVDVVALLVAGQGALIGWRLLHGDQDLLGILLSPYQVWTLWLKIVWLSLFALQGGYDLHVSARVGAIARCLAGTAVFFAVGYLALYFLTTDNPSSYALFGLVGTQVRLLRVVPVLFGAIALLLGLGWRSFYALVLTGDHFLQHVLVVGAGRAGQTLVQALKETPGMGYRIIGYIDDDPAKLGQVIEDVPVMGDHLSLLTIAREHSVNELALSISSGVKGNLFASVMSCFEQGIQITPMPLIYERLTGRVPVEHVGQQWYLSLPLSAKPPNWAFRVVERAHDLVLALIGLVFLAVLIPFVALGNLLFSPGPLFYWQTRVGKRGRLFRVVKLRTMIPEAEEQCGAVWARENDPRTTRFGRWLRKSRLDEVPQFWNVFKGEMSLVGPRPERPEFIEELAEKIPFYRVRHAVKPGITGWAQVRYRYGSSVQDALIKLQYDLYYIKHQSLYLNLLIVLKTIGVVLKMGGT
jgi:exopolysaccharide biosynthesis polyprenyl glycosylphosphotransferase